MKETELCEIFIAAAEMYGWTCYPETSGWDILLVRDGTQIGVQAKTTANIKVIAQCLPPMYWFGRRLFPSVRRKIVKHGPNFRAVLIPDKTSRSTKKNLCNVCQALGIWTFTEAQFGWHLLEQGYLQGDYDWLPDELEWLPDVIPKVEAGSKSPTRLTQWKQCALRLLARAQVRGYVTSRDAKEIGCDMRIFITPAEDQWLRFKEKKGRFHAYIIAEDPDQHSKRPDLIHPEAYQYFLEEAKKEISDEA